VRAVALANCLMGAGTVRVVGANTIVPEAVLTRVHGTWRIYVRSDLSEERATFAVLHEIAHWVLGRAASEDACDALATAILRRQGGPISVAPGVASPLASVAAA